MNPTADRREIGALIGSDLELAHRHGLPCACHPAPVILVYEQGRFGPEVWRTLPDQLNQEQVAHTFDRAREFYVGDPTFINGIEILQELADWLGFAENPVPIEIDATAYTRPAPYTEGQRWLVP